MSGDRTFVRSPFLLTPDTADASPGYAARIGGSICSPHVPRPRRSAETTATRSSSCRTTAFCLTDGILHQEAVAELGSQCSSGGIPDAVLSHIVSSLQRPGPELERHGQPAREYRCGDRDTHEHASSAFCPDPLVVYSIFATSPTTERRASSSARATSSRAGRVRSRSCPTAEWTSRMPTAVSRPAPAP